MRLHTSLLAIGLLVLSAGCLNLDLLEGETTPEGAVIVSFTAHGSGGAPAGGMESADFEILEDGELVSEYESQQTILNPKAQFRLVSILLLDMSGSILESGNLSALQEAAVAYVEATTQVSEVGIYRFDGRADIVSVVEVTDDLTVLRDGIESLGTVCDTDECDASTNLNGAVIDTLSLLDDIEDESPRIFAGSVVVFTDGTDRASRASADDAVARVKGSDHDVYSIGLGGEVDRTFLNKIGKSGTVYAGDAGDVSAAFTEVAASVSDESTSFYSLVYCSPSRAGTHEVTIRGAWGSMTGSLKYEFDAGGFDGSCDASEFEVAEDGDDDEASDDDDDDDVAVHVIVESEPNDGYPGQGIGYLGTGLHRIVGTAATAGHELTVNGFFTGDVDLFWLEAHAGTYEFSLAWTEAGQDLDMLLFVGLTDITELGWGIPEALAQVGTVEQPEVMTVNLEYDTTYFLLVANYEGSAGVEYSVEVVAP